MDTIRKLFTNYSKFLSGGSKPAKKSNNPGYTRTNKKEKLEKRTYVLYKRGKFYYVKHNGEFKSLSTMRRKNGIKPY